LKVKSAQNPEMQRVLKMIPNAVSLRNLSGVLAAALVVFGPCATAATTPSLTTLYSFVGASDGSAPEADLNIDENTGNLYGTTFAGGAFGWGAVYELLPPATSGGSWNEQLLYSFTGGADGANPQSGLTRDASTGILYGTTFSGGTGFGVIYQLTPPAVQGENWSQTVLYSFTGGLDGANPQARLLLSSTGVLYGTTKNGGAGSNGVAFKFEVSAMKFGLLYVFSGGKDGANPQAGLLVGEKKFYGTTYQGGTPGYGTVFELVLTKSHTGPVWKLKTLYPFTGGPDGGIPNAGLFMDASGSLFGSTFWGGTNSNCLQSGYPAGCGVVFQLIPPTTQGGAWSETVLYSFTGVSPDGAHPNLNVIRGTNGTIYGTTYAGGSREDNCFVDSSFRGCGTIFRLTPPSVAGGAYTETTLHIFRNKDGGGPYGMIRGLHRSGVFYGATYLGGSNGSFGTVFQFMP
jgi:hypothetical protein